MIYSDFHDLYTWVPVIWIVLSLTLSSNTHYICKSLQLKGVNIWKNGKADTVTAGTKIIFKSLKTNFFLVSNYTVFLDVFK